MGQTSHLSSTKRPAARVSANVNYIPWGGWSSHGGVDAQVEQCEQKGDTPHRNALATLRLYTSTEPCYAKPGEDIFVTSLPIPIEV